MTDREALLALAAPEPDWVDDGPKVWQAWKADHDAALAHVAEVQARPWDFPTVMVLGDRHDFRVMVTWMEP